MAIAFTSRLALRDTLPRIGGLQREVYEAIAAWPHLHIGPCIADLATKLERKEGSICARLNELREAGAIENGPLKMGACGKEVMTYIALAWREPERAAQMTLL